MLGTFAHQQLPATTLIVGDKAIVIKQIEQSSEQPEPAVERATDPVAKVSTLAPSAPSTELGILTFPVQGYDAEAVISVFGDKRGSSRMHQGIDIKAPKGTPVVAVTDGFVERIKDGGSGGKQLYLRDGRGRLYFYAHLSSWSVKEFSTVRAGEALGTVGNTGNASKTTPHLHFEVLVGKDKQAIDPLRFWAQA